MLQDEILIMNFSPEIVPPVLNTVCEVTTLAHKILELFCKKAVICITKSFSPQFSEHRRFLSFELCLQIAKGDVAQGLVVSGHIKENDKLSLG